MRKKFWLFLVVFGFAVLCLSLDSISPTSDKTTYQSIQKLIEGKQIDARIYGLGTYQQECVQMELENKNTDSVCINIEAGRRLVTEDSSMQNILLVRKDSIKLAPGQKVVHKVYGFCCNATRHVPAKDAVFSVGKIAHPPLQKLAVFLSEHDYSITEMQSAIWAVSDKYSIASIGDAKDPKAMRLREYVAKVLGVVVPWYNVSFKKDSTLCSGIPEKLFATFDYHINTNGFADLVIVDEHNMPRKVLFKNAAHNPDSYHYTFTLDVADWPRGKYFVRLVVDGARKLEKVIQI